MGIIVLLCVCVVFIYTIGFATTLWRDKNKAGFVAVVLLAIGIVVAPFFSKF